jgi:sulfate adenylyltransferase subunit 2
VIDLYFDRGSGTRYRSPRLWTVHPARAVEGQLGPQVVDELRTGRHAKVADRAGRAQDAADDGGRETRRRQGYI